MWFVFLGFMMLQITFPDNFSKLIYFGNPEFVCCIVNGNIQ